jgi:hypothetical protein
MPVSNGSDAGPTSSNAQPSRFVSCRTMALHRRLPHCEHRTRFFISASGASQLHGITILFGLSRSHGMSTEGIDQKITQYLNTPSPTYAVLLRGAWGVGKSFFWNQFKNRAMPEGKKDITFSVAGLITLEELERALFVASIQDWGPGLLQETGTVVGRALLRWVKVEPQDIKLKADVRPDHTVICIDDVERFGGDFRVLFGFIVSLLDEAHLHVVLIADEERALALPGYRDYRERIISRAFDVAPAVEDVFQGVVNGYSNERIRAAILETQAYALSLFEQKCLTNLRTIRAILDEMNAILSGMQWPQGKTASLMKLFSAITFHAMAVSKDPSNAALVNRTFLQSDLGMALVLRERKRGKGNADGKEDEPPGIHTLIQGLRFEADAHEWPVSPSFAAYVRGQTYDANSLATEFGIFGTAADADQPLRMQLRNYRSMSEEQFRDAVENLRITMEKRQFHSVHEIWELFEIWYHLSTRKLVKDTPRESRDLFLEVIGSIDPASDIQPNLEIWPESRDADQVAVIDALRSLETRIRAERQKATNKQFLNAIIEGVGEEPREVHLALFVGEDPADIFERIAAAGRPAIHRMSQFFRRRFGISNIAEFTAAEAPFACALAEIIESKQVQVGDRLTLDQAAFHELAVMLRHFSQAVGQAPSSTVENPEAPEGNANSQE